MCSASLTLPAPAWHYAVWFCLCRIAKTKQAAAAGAAVTKGVATGMQVRAAALLAVCRPVIHMTAVTAFET